MDTIKELYILRACSCPNVTQHTQNKIDSQKIRRHIVHTAHTRYRF